MNKFTAACYRSLTIALINTLILTVTPTVLIKHANAQPVFAEQGAFNEAELAQILAPIALYPDSLLTHILIASTYPLEIVQANRWRNENSHLSAEQAIKKSEHKGWEPSVSALLAFPNVLDKLSVDLTWTQKLGDAFLQDEPALLSSIQSLRRQADAADSLSEMDNMSVTRVEQHIIIEPAEKEIIYVPYYDSRVVYGHWQWYSHPPVYWTPYPYYIPHLHSHFYWGSAVHISFDYYFSTFNWRQRHIVVVNHHNSHYYRHRERIVTSHGAQRWIHKPQHRRGVSYHSENLKQRYNRHYPERAQVDRIQNKLREQRTDRKMKYSGAHNSRKLATENRPRIKKREQSPANNMHQPLLNKQHNAVPRNQRGDTKNHYQSQGEGKRQKQMKSEKIQRNRHQSGQNQEHK